jgi:hypothetical protein
VAVDGVGGATGTARLQIGETFRNVRLHPATGAFQFELAGAFWTNNVLRTGTNLGGPPEWSDLLYLPKSTNDWIIGYTNPTPLAVPRRFYTLELMP